jgi:hypothetical protein
MEHGHQFRSGLGLLYLECFQRLMAVIVGWLSAGKAIMHIIPA